MKLSELGEDGLVEKLRERVPQPGPAIQLGIGDDAAAILVPAGENLLVSSDTLVEEVHFTRRTLPPSFIGRKAVAVNASDIAAMGGRPLAVVVSLSVSTSVDVEELLELFEGVIRRSADFEIDLIGGNLSSSPGPTVVNVCILGATVQGRILKRSGAKVGDSVYVSGKLGAAAEGLELLKEGMALSASGALLVPGRLREGPLPLAETCIRAHMDPEPRVDLGRFLSESGAATACIDLSDGLSRDLRRLCRESGVGALIEETALPIHPGVLAWERVRRRPVLEQALSGGEDYELLFTSSDGGPLARWQEREMVGVTRIGRVTEAREGVRIILREGTERVLTSGGWDHFQAGSGSISR